MLAEKVGGWAAQYERKGERKGEKKGRIELLEQQLARRFGAPLPAWVRPRLEKADTPQLDNWAVRIFDAPSLEALFDQPA